jgi:peptidoglycan/LPS O-acetylase OafA/YrhL
MNGRITLAFSFLLGNVYILRHGWIGPVDPLWSLSVEEQFYVAVPAIVRLGGKRAVEVIGAVTIALAYAVLVWLGLHATNSMVVWVNSFVQFQFFAAGGLIALWSNNQRPASPLKWKVVQLAVGLAFWVEAAKLYPLHTLKQTTVVPLIIAYLLMLFGTSLIFTAIIQIQLRIPAILIYLGKISYGLYMFHALVLWFLYDTTSQLPRMAYFRSHPLITIPLAFGLTIAIAALSYHFFERPILKYKERFETIRTRPA